MACQHLHGRVDCTRCFACANTLELDTTNCPSSDETRRITWNPLAWGNAEPEIVVLGFSKGPTQVGALASASHDAIAYKGSRTSVGKILANIGAVPAPKDGLYKEMVDGLVKERSGRFYFGSLVRCTVERYDEKSRAWKGSGGGMLDRSTEAGFGNEVATNCASEFLGKRPARTRLVVMFGQGTKLNYVRATRRLLESARPGRWRTPNNIAYSDGRVTFVHVEHFASQGALIPNWLGENDHPQSEYGRKARDAVRTALIG